MKDSDKEGAVRDVLAGCLHRAAFPLRLSFPRRRQDNRVGALKPDEETADSYSYLLFLRYNSTNRHDGGITHEKRNKPQSIYGTSYSRL